MTDPIPLLVFTDLDGTLLSHDDYEWHAAAPALDRLAAIGAGVVMASSKTAAEIAVIRDDLGLQDWPAIVENGAGLLPAGSTTLPARDTYHTLRAVLDKIPAALRRQFTGFGDMDAAGIARVTGLDRASTQRAATRAFSEPGTWEGTAEDLQHFLDALRAHGVSARSGGRFLTLTFGRSKADQMSDIIAHYAPRNTVALGDAPNDTEMLEAADTGIIIANPHRDPLPSLDGEDTGRILRSTRAGPEGWTDEMLRLLTRLGL